MNKLNHKKKKEINRQTRRNSFRKWFWRSSVLIGIGTFATSFYISNSNYKTRDEKVEQCRKQNTYTECTKKIENEQRSIHHKTLFAGFAGALLAGIGTTMSDRKKREWSEANS